MSDSLPQRMREAAKVLDEASAWKQLNDDSKVPWTAFQLRYTADHIEAEDNAAAERETMVEELAQDVVSAFGVPWAWSVLADRDKWLRMTRKLIADGWTKQVQS